METNFLSIPTSYIYIYIYIGSHLTSSLLTHQFTQTHSVFISLSLSETSFITSISIPMAFDGAKKKVVVVGGGMAGALLVKSLQFHADVTLVDPKEYYEITWASQRSKVEPLFAERIVIKHSDYFTNGHIIISTAIGVTETEVLTSDGHQILYDYLVIATGHNESFPKSRTQRLQQYQEDYKKISSAESILIVGGGPSGVEFAGEIAVDFPEKKVTLVHKQQRLLDFIGSKASNKTLDWLTSKKVEVILGQTVNLNSHSEKNKSYQISNGKTIRADCHFLCIGKGLSTSWIKDSVLGDSIDARGRLMVDEYLRVKGQNNVFAIGDITDIPELKQGFLAQKHALLTAENLKLLIDGKDKKMSSYKTGSEMAIVSLGRKEAVAQFPFVTTIGCMPGLIKSKDLFVGKTRKQLGLESNGGKKTQACSRPCAK